MNTLIVYVRACAAKVLPIEAGEVVAVKRSQMDATRSTWCVEWKERALA